MSHSLRRPRFLERSASSTLTPLAFRPLHADTPPAPPAPSAPSTPPPSPPQLDTAPLPSEAPAQTPPEVTPARVVEAPVPSFQRLSATLERIGEGLKSQLESDALAIGFALARHLLERELSQSPEALLGWVRSTVRDLGETRSLRLRLAPSDLHRLDVPVLRHSLQLVSLELVPDDSLKPGDCLAETDTCSVDGRLEANLDELRRVLQSALAEDAP